MEKVLKQKQDVEKPWGKFELFAKGEPVTVKIITVNPGQSLSLQYHYKREEFWKVLSGEAEITIGNSFFRAKANDEYFIKKKEKHRLKAGKSLVKILEISFGCFEEEDIVRLEDKYNRVSKNQERR